MRRSQIIRDIKKILWNFSYGDFRNGNLKDANDFDDYPSYIALKIADYIEKRQFKMLKKIDKKITLIK